MKTKLIAVAATSAALFTACQSGPAPQAELVVTPQANNLNKGFTVRPASGPLGSIERLDPALDALLGPDAVIEKLAVGFDWSEGPVWMPGNYLLFSDVPLNMIFRWDARSGVSIHQSPSGYTGATPRGGEPGSNGLTRDQQGRLIACQHGDRRVARWENGRFVTVADKFEGKRFNSPNDLCFHSNGDLYFTDPPYGLPKSNWDDPSPRTRFLRRLSAQEGRRPSAAHQGNDPAQRHRPLARREDALRRALRSQGSPSG